MFNPFDKPFQDVQESDLEILKNVSEGWYVEYKREKSHTCTAKKIAKAVASFANSYGGLFLLGVESDKKTNKATDFPGVSDSPDIIKDAVKSTVQPFPFFETHCIKLANGKHVLMSVVREGESPPYLHNDGCIYKRQEASSDPIPENNRHAVDELYLKRQHYQKELDAFRQIDYQFCKAEDTPMLEIFLNTTPRNPFEIKSLIISGDDGYLLKHFSSPYEIKDLKNNTNMSIAGQIPFDTFNTYHDSVVVRQMNGKNLSYNGLSVEIDTCGNTKICIPLSLAVSDMQDISNLDVEYAKVLNRYHSDSFRSLNFIDSKNLLGAVFGLLVKVFDFLISKGYTEDIEVMFRLTNCWRTTIHFNSQTFRDHVKKCGIPVCMKDTQFFPNESIYFSNEDLKTPSLFKLLSMFAWISIALGIPGSIAGIAGSECLTQ